MKKLVIIPLLFIGIRLKAQESRWMYLSKTNDGAIILVDTVKDDIKQVEYFEGHDDVVFFWINQYKKIKTAKGSNVTTEMFRLAVDTANKQIQSTSYTKYKNGVVVHTPKYFETWTDVVPGSRGDLFVKFAKSVNNDKILTSLILEAIINYNPYSKEKPAKVYKMDSN